LSKHKDNSMAIFQEAFTVELAKAMGKVAAIETAARARKPNPITVSPEVLPADEWAGLIVKRGSDAQEHWKTRTLSPSKDPIAEGIKAEAFYASQTKKSIDNQARKKALEKVTLAEYGEDVEATPASAYGDALKRKELKIKRKIGKLQPLVEGLRKAIAAMPADTDSQRENKMRAARRGEIVIGQVMKGVVGPEAIGKAIAELGR